MSPVILFPFYLIVTFAPLVFAWLQGLPARPVQDELATGLGMVAFSILLSEFALSGRFKVISARMGMDVTMRVHQLAARAALLFSFGPVGSRNRNKHSNNWHSLSIQMAN